MKTHIRVGAAIATAFLLALAVTACGSGSGQSTSQSKGPSTQKITLISPGDFIGYGAFEVAVGNEYFDQQGLKISHNIAQAGAPAAVAALSAGGAQIAGVGSSTAAAYLAKGQDIKFLAVTSIGYAPELVATDSWMQKHNISKGAPVKDIITALKGSKLGIESPGDSIYQLYVYLLNQYNVPISSITFVPLGTGAGEVAGLKTGRVDVMAASPPYGEQAASEGAGTILVRPQDIPSLSQYPYSVWLTTSKALSSHAAALTSFLRALAQAGCLIHNDPSAAKAAEKTQFPTLSDAAFDQSWQATVPTLATSPMVTQAQYTQYLKFQTSSGKHISASYSDAVPSSFIQSALKGVQTC